MVQLFIIFGACILGLLGAIHLWLVLFTPKFHASNHDVNFTLQSTNLIITRQTTFWKAWIGFNVSHSVGLIFIAAIYIPLAIHEIEMITRNFYFLFLPVFISTVYLGLSIKYWFKIPMIGFALSLLCFLLASLKIVI